VPESWGRVGHSDHGSVGSTIQGSTREPVEAPRAGLNPDAGVDGAGTIILLGDLTNITTQRAHDALAVANIDSQA